METEYLTGGTCLHTEPDPDVRLQQTIMHHSCSHVLDRIVGWQGLIVAAGGVSLLVDGKDVLRCHEFSVGHHPNLFQFFRKAVLSVSLSFLNSPSQSFVSFEKDSCCFPYLSTLVSASRLFMMPRAPTPPENPFWRELELDWRGCPMAISESCFCIIARFTCRKGKT